jgi:hypothetical protein
MATVQEQAREAEERRYGAVQALNAVVECLRETNPQTIFSAKEGSGLEPMKLQNINNRWAEKAADVLGTALDLADCIGVDAMAMFKSHHGKAVEGPTEIGA